MPKPNSTPAEPADASPPPTTKPFWETTALADMTTEQWESLCDGCGKCCLNKYENEDTGYMHYSNVACLLLDPDTCRCTDYTNRARRVPDCVDLNVETIANPRWLPETCAYRRLARNEALPEWHPLITGDPMSVLRAGHSVSGRVISETEVDDPLHHLIDWIC